MERVFSYQRNYTHEVRGFRSNVYIKHVYETHRRNFGLWLIPSTYAIAKGSRSFVSEQYNRMEFRSLSDFDNKRQVYYTTIPRNRRTLPILFEFVTPNLYDVTMYGDHILSPFNRENRLYYTYNTADIGHGHIRLYFRPRFTPNTQLVRGRAIVERRTGRIEQLEMEGEYDMIHFRTLTMQGDYGARSLLPKLCRTSIEFKFAGNHVTSEFTALYDCPITLPDTLDIRGNRNLIDSVRPISLSENEMAIYEKWENRHKSRKTIEEAMRDSMAQDSLFNAIDSALTAANKRQLRLRKDSVMAADSVKKDSAVSEPHHDYLKEIGWDIIGYHLIRSQRHTSENLRVKLSPLLNPQYIGYSGSRGFSYKIKLNSEYRFSPTTILSFDPRAGYSFKRNELYYETPFWLFYNPKRDGMLFVTFEKGNRITNSYVLDDIKKILGDTPETENLNLDAFDDYRVHAINRMRVNEMLTASAGLTYHLRRGYHHRKLTEIGMPGQYQSLAPALSVSIRTWPRGPVATVDYERTINNKHLNLKYERWEFDLSERYGMTHLQALKLRIGGGLYTLRNGNAFMDFANFRDNNLPEGWNDDWSGNFQLLSSSLYNESRYYLRSNITYESPLLAASFLPLIGRYVEREQTFLSSLSIEHSRLYSELGYGFTSRYFSMGFFTSFLNLDYQRFTAKFTLELFRRW